MLPTKIHSNSIFLCGGFLVYGLFVVFFVSIILTGSLSFVANSTKVSLQTVSRNEAFHVSEAGVLWYRWYLSHMVDGRTAQQIQAFWEGGTALGVNTAYTGVYEDSSGPVGHYSITVIPPVTGSTIVTVTSRGWMDRDPSAIRTIKVRFRRASWSEYSALANDEMRFGEGTEVYGRIHSNFGIRFDGLAHNLVSSSLSRYNDPDHNGNDEFAVHTHVNVSPGSGTNDTFRAAEAPPATVPARADVFQAGRVFPVPTVDFTGVLADLNLMKSQAQSGNGRYFDSSGNGWRFILKTNDTYDACKVKTVGNTSHEISTYYKTSGSGICSECSGACVQNYPIVDGGVIFAEQDAWIEGQVDGKRITIVAANLTSSQVRNVYIKHGILYSHYDGSDIIGIIGQNNISLTENSDYDIRIDAALLAQQGRVGRDDYTTNGGCNCGRSICEDHKGTISLFGSMASNQRYGFSYVWNASCHNMTGYSVRKLIFDNTLLYYPPPFFPTGTQYLMDLWEEL